MARKSIPEVIGGLMRDARIQALLIGGVALGVISFWQTSSYPAPRRELAPVIVGLMGDEEWRVMGPGGAFRKLPKDGMDWAGQFDCDRDRERPKGGHPKNAPYAPPSFRCIIGVIEPTGERYPVVIRLTYATDRSARSQKALFGYAPTPNLPPFFLHQAPPEEAIEALRAAGAWPF